MAIYDLYQPGTTNYARWSEICTKYHLPPDKPTLMLPHGFSTIDGEKIPRMLWETRRLYFGLAVGPDGRLNEQPIIAHMESLDELPVTRIISFGSCNVHCPYCKRDCQFVDDEGQVIVSIPVPLNEILACCVSAHERGEIVRFSGGDPVMFRRETLAIAQYMWQMHGAKVSIAHNGSGTKWAGQLSPYLGSAAIDLKATPERIAQIMGIEPEKGPMMYQRSVDTQGVLSHARVLVDVRTPVFGDTPIEDMRRLASDICAANNLRYTFWTWRLYKEVKGCDWPVPDKDTVIAMMLQVSAEFPDMWLGIRAKWQRGGMVYIRAGRIVDSSVDTSTSHDAEVGSGNREILCPEYAL